MKTEKAVLISIRPKWCEKIASVEKIIEVRKTRPKLQPPFKCYIYCTKGGVALGAWGKHGKVIGEFTCDRVYELETHSPGGSYFVAGEGKPTTNRVARESCLGLADMHRYLQSKTGYGWHISDLKIYDATRELGELRRACPNSFCCESCAMYRENDNTCGNESLQIKRAPQSWCYVEEG